MNIAFTGHRDKVARDEDLLEIARKYPGATWVHGGAIGFDSQVDQFAKAHNIPRYVIKPDYQKYGHSAPLVRNREIVDMGDLVVALYDGRGKGGTFYTINYARQQKKTVEILSTV